jgi:hypothetical protein
MSDKESITIHQMGDLKVTEGGKIYLKDRLVQGVTFDQPVEVPDQEINAEPTPMLYQPPFYLSEQNFVKIRRPSGKLAGFGWSCVGLSLITGFRLLIKLSEMGFSEPSLSSLKLEIMITAAILLVGFLSVALSFWLSRSKNAVLKEIGKHFEANPPKLEIRRSRRTK